MAMKIADLKRTDADKAKEAARYEKGSQIGQEDYPYGTSVRLEHEDLAKLGITSADQLPKSGATMNIAGNAKVASVSTNDRDGEARHSMELQLTHLGVEPSQEDKEAAAAKAMYPSAKS